MNPNQPPHYPPHYPPHVPPGMPPVPRDHDKATLTEILPFGSRKIRMTRSPLTIFLLACAVATPLLLALLQTSLESYDASNHAGVLRAFKLTAQTATFLMAITTCLIMYFYAKPGRSIWPFLMAFVFLVLILFQYAWTKIPFIWEGFNWLFRTAMGWTVEQLLAPGQPFSSLFPKMFVAAGLCEELFKALPILFGALLALAYQRSPRPRPGLVRFFQIRGPLDGALMGVFVGAAFTFFETGFGYVPRVATQIYEITGNPAAGTGYGLMLLFPRVIGGIVGHSAYSAIFGYFIGLAVLRPRNALLLIPLGWVLASLLHGLWNSVDALAGWLSYVVAILSAIFAVAVILKGRQLNQTASGDVDTMGSILVDRGGGGAGAGGGYGQPAYGGYPAQGGYPAPQPAYGGYPSPQPYPQAQNYPQAGYPAAPAQGFPPPPQPFQAPAAGLGYPQPPQPEPEAPSPPPPDLEKREEPPSEPAPSEPPAATPTSEAPTLPQPTAWPSFEHDLAPQAPTETFAANVAPPPPPAPGEPPLVLDIAGLVIPIRAGALIDLGAEPALGGRGAGMMGEVVPHPTRPGVLGLRNAGSRAWTAHLRDGRVQPIAPNQNVRMAGGVRIDFGDGILAAVVAQG